MAKERISNIIRFYGKMMDMIYEIIKKYKQYKYPTKLERALLYGEMNRSVYGRILSEILWHRKLRGHLKIWDFEMNLYDEYTFNNDGQRGTIYNIISRPWFEDIILWPICNWQHGNINQYHVEDKE